MLVRFSLLLQSAHSRRNEFMIIYLDVVEVIINLFNLFICLLSTLCYREKMRNFLFTLY